MNTCSTGQLYDFSVIHPCVCMFILYPLSFPSIGVRLYDVSSECQVDQAGFKDWMSILPSNLMEEISPDPEAFQHRIAEKEK